MKVNIYLLVVLFSLLTPQATATRPPLVTPAPQESPTFPGFSHQVSHPHCRAVLGFSIRSHLCLIWAMHSGPMLHMSTSLLNPSHWKPCSRTRRDNYLYCWWFPVLKTLDWKEIKNYLFRIPFLIYKFKKWSQALAGQLSSLEHHPVHQKVQAWFLVRAHA